AFPPPFTANTDLVVIRRAADGTETPLALTTDYSVSGANNPAGGTVTTTAAPAAGTTLVIIRDVPPTQSMNLQDGGPQPSTTVNRAHDRRAMVEQRLRERADRSIELRETDTDGSGAFDARGNSISNLADAT